MFRSLLVATLLTTTTMVFAAPKAKLVSPPPDTNLILKKDDPSRTFLGSYVQLPNGHVLYARHIKAQGGKPTIYLMNGLDDAATDWEPIVELLTSEGYGVVTFDFRGQGWTLAMNPFNLKNLGWKDQVADVDQLRVFFGHTKIAVSGLSYGGGIAIAYATLHPENVEKIIAFDAYVTPDKAQVAKINSQVDAYMLLNPFANRDEVYKEIFTSTVIIPAIPSEIKIIDQVNKLEATVDLAIGLGGFDINVLYKTLPPQSLVLVGGSEDPLITQPILTNVWNTISASIRSAYVVMLGLQHRTTTYAPTEAATIIKESLDPNGRLNSGRIFTMDLANRLTELKSIPGASFTNQPLSCKDLF